MFENLQKFIDSEEEKHLESLTMPYPVSATKQMIECFDKYYFVEEISTSCLSLIGNVGEELWVYSKSRELLFESEDEEYRNNTLNEIHKKITSMLQELEKELSNDLITSLNELCDSVYNGVSFDNERFNEFINTV